MKIMPLIIIFLINLIGDIALFQSNQARNQKRVLRSGIILTIAGLVYSTIQTRYIVQKLKNQ